MEIIKKVIPQGNVVTVVMIINATTAIGVIGVIVVVAVVSVVPQCSSPVVKGSGRGGMSQEKMDRT